MGKDLVDVLKRLVDENLRKIDECSPTFRMRKGLKRQDLTPSDIGLYLTGFRLIVEAITLMKIYNEYSGRDSFREEMEDYEETLENLSEFLSGLADDSYTS